MEQLKLKPQFLDSKSWTCFQPSYIQIVVYDRLCKPVGDVVIPHEGEEMWTDIQWQKTRGWQFPLSAFFSLFFTHFHSSLRTLAGRWAVRGALPASLSVFSQLQSSVIWTAVLWVHCSLPRPTSVVNFPPRTRDDASLDYISQPPQNCQNAEPRESALRPAVQELRTWGANSPAFGKLAMPLCFWNIWKKNILSS